MVIYILVDPRQPDQIRYVGWTININKRFKSHIEDKRNNHRCNWIRKLLAEGIQPELKVIEKVNEDNWQERERYWIKYYRELGHDLTNATDGGDGTLGLSPSDKHRQAASKTMRRLHQDCKFQEKSRQASSENMKRLQQDPEFREKSRQAASETMKRLHQDPIFQEKQRLAASQTMKWLNEDPQFKEKNRQIARNTMTVLHQDQKFHENSRQACRNCMMKKLKDPEFQAKARAGKARKRIERERLLMQWQDDGGR